MHWNDKKIIPWVLLIAFGLFTGAVVIGAVRVAVRQPFHLDEAEEATMGLKVSTIGPKTFLSVPEGGMDLTHALLYTFSHALVQRIFGHGEFPLRMYGVFYFLISLLLMQGIIRRIIPADNPLRACALALGGLCYLVNPLLIQHAVVVNADNSILTSALLLFIYAFLRFESLSARGYLWSRFVLAFLVACAFWCKELTPLFVLVGVLAFRLIRRQFRKFLVELCIVACGGLLLFWLTWWCYCALTGTDVLGFVKFTLINKSKLAFSANYFDHFWHVIGYGSRWALYWMSAPFFLALLVVCGQRLVSFIRRQQAESVDLVLLCGLAIWLPYHCFRPNMDMMKYQYPAYPLFLSAIVWLLAQWGRADVQRIKELAKAPLVWVAWFTILGGLIFHYEKLGDYLLALSQSLTRHLRGHFLFYYYLPIVLIVLLALALAKRGRRMVAFLCALVFLILPINLGLDANHSRADYLTFEIWLNYGEKGLAEAVAYLQQAIQPEAVIAVRPDIAYYLRYRSTCAYRQNIPPDLIFKIADDQLLTLLLTQAPIQFLVLDPISIALQASRYRRNYAHPRLSRHWPW